MVSKWRTYEDHNLRTLKEIANQVANKECFDCGQRGPPYINMTIGSFVCTSCSGLLRGLNPPHRIKSISMAKYNKEELEFIRNHGNAVCKQIWLKCQSATSEKEWRQELDISEYLAEKYVNKLWCGERPPDGPPKHSVRRKRADSAKKGLEERNIHSVADRLTNEGIAIQKGTSESGITSRNEELIPQSSIKLMYESINEDMAKIIDRTINRSKPKQTNFPTNQQLTQNDNLTNDNTLIERNMNPVTQNIVKDNSIITKTDISSNAGIVGSSSVPIHDTQFQPSPISTPVQFHDNRLMENSRPMVDERLSDSLQSITFNQVHHKPVNFRQSLGYDPFDKYAALAELDTTNQSILTQQRALQEEQAKASSYNSLNPFLSDQVYDNNKTMLEERCMDDNEVVQMRPRLPTWHGENDRNDFYFPQTYSSPIPETDDIYSNRLLSYPLDNTHHCGGMYSEQRVAYVHSQEHSRKLSSPGNPFTPDFIKTGSFGSGNPMSPVFFQTISGTQMSTGLQQLKYPVNSKNPFI